MRRDKWVAVCGEALEREGVKHFHPLEICDVGREGHGAILRAPRPDMIPTAIKLCQVLLYLRSATTPSSVLVNSFYRSSIYNARIGGVPMSMHLTCGAADVVKVGFTPDEVADILEGHPDSDQLGIGRYATFTHLDIRGMIGRTAPARW